MTAEREPIAEQLLPEDERPQPSWAEVRDRLAAAGTYWLATSRPDDRPHVRPVLAVWSDGALHFVASATSRKARNLAVNPSCAITTGVPSMDLVVEGAVAKVRDEATLERVAAVYLEKYDWSVTIRDGAFYGEGAPTAGPPPYEVYRVNATVVFSFGTDKTATAVRWRFS